MCNRTQRNHRPLPHPDPKRSRHRAAYPPLAPSSAYAHQMPDDSESARVPACQGLPARKSLARLPAVVSDHASIRPNRSSRSGDRSVSRARRLYRIPRALSRASRRAVVPLPETRIIHLTVGFPPREENAHLPLRNPTIIARRHYYVKCLGQRVLALGCCGSWRPLQQPEESGALLRTMSST